MEPGCWSGALAFLWPLSSDIPDFWARNAHQIVATQDEKPKWGQPRVEVRLALTPDPGLILQSYTLGTKASPNTLDTRMRTIYKVLLCGPGWKPPGIAL